MMENKQVQDMFHSFNRKYFWGKLDKVRLNWSKNMTLCAGKTYCKERRGNSLCAIYLSEPLLSQRPPEDTINTLLVFHNFRKEVDKFRVHVYHCDGPCTKKRPYFGVLRRAISRPPGPTDRWWAKHSQECGGTFHKVEGPDISPDLSQSTHKPLRASPAVSPGASFPKCTPFPRRMNSSGTQSSGATVRGARSDRNKFMSSVSKRLAFCQEKNTNDMIPGEDQLIQKIKKRHAHTSRSILLSKEKTKMKWRGPSPERGTLVEGRVNYNYKIKSGVKFNIRKYLERYRAAKEAEARTSQKIEVSQSPQASPDAQKFTRLQPTEAHTSRRTEATKVSQASLDKTCTSVSFKTGGSIHTTVPPVVSCWNCGVNVMVPEHVRHSQRVREEESPCDISKMTPQGRKEDSRDNVSSTLVVCPSCGGKVPQEELNSHLDECLMPFTDDF